MKNKKKRNLIIVLSSILIIVTIGISYAFITQVLSGDKQVVINSGVLKLVLDEKNQVTVSDALPMFDQVGKIQEPFTFSLINETSNDTEYVLNLVDVTVGDKLSPSDVRYYLTKNDKEIGPDYLSSLGESGVVGETIQAQTLKFCKLFPIFPTDQNIETLEDCVENPEEIYNLMAEYSIMSLSYAPVAGIISYPADLGWAVCNSGGSATESECLAAISSELPQATSYEDIGNYMYLSILGGIPDTSSVETLSSSYCELKLQATTETDCISVFNSTYETSFSSYDEVTNYMLESGMIPEEVSSVDFSGTIDQGTIKGNTTIDYTLRMWISDEVTDNSAISGKSISYKLEVKAAQVIAEASCPPIPKTTPNEPELASGMIAVTYNETDKTWVKADTTNNNWYDYDNQMWANAVTVTESTRSNYMAMDAGEPISMDDINTMWVWIPRYSYTIMQPYGRGQKCSELGEITLDSPSSCRQTNYPSNLRRETLNICKSELAELDVNINSELECTAYLQLLGGPISTFEDVIDSFIKLGKVEDTRTLLETYPNKYVNTSTFYPGAIDVKFISAGEKDNGTGKCEFCASDWVTPEGFTFGNEELSGFWVAKYATGGTIGDPCTNTECQSANLIINENSTAISGISISNGFYATRSMQNSFNVSKYGFDALGTGTMDTHVMKNTEWGIVAMLSQSTYGKYGNDDYDIESKEVSPDESTTGNSYGIYDMSDGEYWSEDFVMAVYDKYSGYDFDANSGFCGKLMHDTDLVENCGEWPDDKYYDLYTSTISSDNYKIGDATYETGGWYNDNQYRNTNYSWISRGGNTMEVLNTVGIFGYNYIRYDLDDSYEFHIVLKP